MSLEEMNLAQLFDESDRIGDKYLTAEEIAERDQALSELADEIYDEPTAEIEERVTALELEVAAVKTQFSQVLAKLEVLVKLVG